MSRRRPKRIVRNPEKDEHCKDCPQKFKTGCKGDGCRRDEYDEASEDCKKCPEFGDSCEGVEGNRPCIHGDVEDAQNIED